MTPSLPQLSGQLAASLAVCASIFGAGEAIAAQSAFGCHARVYTASELAANPGQTVAALGVRFKPFKGDPADRVAANVDLSVRFTDRPGVWTTAGGCGRRDGGLVCGFDGDMGGLTAHAERAGLRIEIPNYVAIEVAPAGDRRVSIEGKANQTFLLAKAKSNKPCELKP